MSKLIILGAGGHGRVAGDIATATGLYDSIAYLDDAILPYEYVVGKTEDYVKYISEPDTHFFVAVGNAEIRKRLVNNIKTSGGSLVTLIHPSSVLGANVIIGIGSVIMPGAVINNGATIGEGVIINTCSSVDHDCKVGDYCHISVGAHICGTVTTGTNVWVGAGATVINNICVAENVFIGAGATVVKNIDIPGTYVGTPARLLKRSER